MSTATECCVGVVEVLAAPQVVIAEPDTPRATLTPGDGDGPDVVEVVTGPQLVVTSSAVTATLTPAVYMPGPPGPQGETGPQGEQGEPGPPGAGGVHTVTAAHTVSGHRVVAFTATGAVEYASPADPAHAWATIAVTAGAALAGEQVQVIAHGMLTEPSWAWTPRQAVYLGPGGALTQTPPSTPGEFLRVVGVAASPTQLWIAPAPPIVLT